MNDSERLGRFIMAIEAIPRHYDNLIAIGQMKLEMVSLKSNNMTKITPLQRLIFHLDEASSAAFELQKNTELPVNMAKLYKILDDYVTDLMEHEANLPTNND